MSGHDAELRARWRAHVTDDVRPLDGVVARHREPHRRYHGVDHLVWVLRHVAELAADEDVSDVDAVVAAAFYHDAVYEPGSPTNESSSARLARRELAELGWPDPRVTQVVAMIESTATHGAPGDVDTAVLLDADLGVFAADPSGYREYVNGVRFEYRHVDDAAWTSGRAAVVRSYLERPVIYATDTARRRWEHLARANLTAELATLGSTPS